MFFDSLCTALCVCLRGSNRESHSEKNFLSRTDRLSGTSHDSSLVMPDIFTGLAVLCAFLLLYDNDLPLEKAILFALLFALAVAVHLSNFLTVPLVLLGILVLRLFNRTRQLWPTCSLSRFVAFILSPVLAMVGILCLSNWRAAHEFRFSAAGPMFLLGRLIDNGMARDYLIHECRTEPLAACKYLNNLPDGNNFLWGSHPLMQDMGGWYHGGIEANKIVYGTIRRYPLRFTIDCLKQTVAAFMVFSQQTENLPYPGFVKDLNRFFPGDGAKYLLTMQWRGWLSKLGNKLYPLYRFIFWVALITGLFFLVSGRGSERANQLMVMVLLLLIANAAVTGSISGVVNRYQARVNWMSSLCCGVYVILYLINRRHSLDMARRGLISPCGETEKWSTGESHLTDDDAEMAPGQL